MINHTYTRPTPSASYPVPYLPLNTTAEGYECGNASQKESGTGTVRAETFVVEKAEEGLFSRADHDYRKAD